MKKFKKVLTMGISMLASLSVLAALSSSVGACHFWFAQPKVPEGLEKFKKSNKL